MYRYYVGQTVPKYAAGSCPVGRVPEGEIEDAVIGQLRALFRQPEIVTVTQKAAHARDEGLGSLVRVMLTGGLGEAT